MKYEIKNQPFTVLTLKMEAGESIKCQSGAMAWMTPGIQMETKTGGLGGMRAFQMALDNAGLNPEDVDYINAHGTSTHLNDLCETQAIKALFGDHARKLAISSTKGAMGHGLGAAGGFETIIASKSIETGIVPPTINYTTPDPECDLDYTPNVARERKVDVALNTNLGFGGHNGVIALRRCK